MLERVLQLDAGNAAARAAIKIGRFEAGVAAARGNRRAEARSWLRLACADDPNNESAWLWLASATDDSDEAIRHLQRALELNPANEKARAGIEQLRSRSPVIWHCPICLAMAESPPPKCPQCRAVLDLARGDEAIGNPNPNVMRIQEGAARLSNKLKAKPDFQTHYFLGVALLNLGKPEAALAHFRTCQQLSPADKSLATHVDLLERALEEAAQPTRRLPQVAPSQTEQPKQLILVVDDSTIMRKLVGMTVNKAGYRVLEAQSSDEALEVIESAGKPDMILVDFVIPSMDGYAFCQVIRNNPITAEVPVIMMTTRDVQVDQSRGRSAGVAGYLTVPFIPATLLGVVREFCCRDGASGLAPMD